MQALAGLEIMKKITNGTISVSDKRCENIDVITKQPCNRKLIIKDGKEFCFNCEYIAKEDLIVKEQSEEMIKNRELNELLSMFKQESLINEDLKDANFDNYEPDTSSQKDAFRISKEYVEGFDKKKGLVFAGKSGVGKSHLSVAITKEIMKRKYSCLFISIPQLMTSIKNTYKKDSEKSEMDILNALQKVDLLIFDDLGAEREDDDDKGTAWAKQKIFEITDRRAGKATIYTSNYSGSQLMRMYGERDFGRMVKDCIPVTVAGENYRLKQFRKGAS